MLRVVPENDARQELALALDEICRRGAEQMLAIALEAEVDAYLERHRQERDERDHALVVRNGHARPRTVVTGAGGIEVRAPRVDAAELVRRCLANSSRAGDAVLDPFAGSGSTLVAAELGGRRGYGLEVDPAYVDVALRTRCPKRLAGQVAQLVGAPLPWQARWAYR